MKKSDYHEKLHALQVELVKLQRHFIRCDQQIVILLEGRDSAGKDGTIKRIVRHLSPRETRIVALGKPSDRDLGSWYFQRFAQHLPAAGEFVLFNRSWYNRAGVEPVMGFCTEEQHAEFLETVQVFEQMLVRSGIRLFKYYLDISKAEQKRRLQDRREDVLKQWKSSPVDAAAVGKWKQYSRARDEMLIRTHHAVAPWTIVSADDKRAARVALISDLLVRLDYDDKDKDALRPDPETVFRFEAAQLESGMIAR
jgi:polyphosphate kinase 2